MPFPRGPFTKGNPHAPFEEPESGGSPGGAAGGDLEGSTYPNPVIAALKITAAKLAAGAVTATKIGAEAVENAAIKALAVTEAKLGELSVSTIKIAALAVTEAKIAAEAVTEAKLAAAVRTTLVKPVIPAARVVRAAATLFEPSPTKACLVVVTVEAKPASAAFVEIFSEGVAVAYFKINVNATESDARTASFLVRAGASWQYKVETGAITQLQSCYTFLTT